MEDVIKTLSYLRLFYMQNTFSLHKRPSLYCVSKKVGRLWWPKESRGTFDDFTIAQKKNRWEDLEKI